MVVPACCYRVCLGLPTACAYLSCLCDALFIWVLFDVRCVHAILCSRLTFCGCLDGCMLVLWHTSLMPMLVGRPAQSPPTALSAVYLRLSLLKLRYHYRWVSVLHRRFVSHLRVVQDAIGDGGLYTLWAGLVLLAELMILLVLYRGKQWREASIDAGK